MTPAKVAHIMELVDKYGEACDNFTLGAHSAHSVNARAAVEAALSDAPQAEPVAWHVNFRGSSHLLTSLDSVDLTDCIVTPLYPEPRAPDNTLKDRLLAALERAAGAESALRRLADKTEPLTQTRGYHALVQVIYELQQDGNYSDEEGEETSALVELLRAIEATPSAPQQAEPVASVEIFRLDANINGVDHQLVEFVRYEDHARVVHDLETICDPAGLVRENAQLRDTNEGLQRMYRAALSPAQQDAVDAWTEEDMDSLCWSAFESAMAGGVSVDSFRWLANSLRAKQLPQRAAISAKKGGA